MTLTAETTLLGEYTYELRPVERGYANRTLYINLADNSFREKPVTQQMKDLFTGGRGFALKLLWDAVTPATTWDDVEENETLIKVFRDGVVVALLEKDITESVDLPTLYPGQGTIHYQVQNIASDGHTSESADLHLSYVCSLY
jgi:hypothetical protein